MPPKPKPPITDNREQRAKTLMKDVISFDRNSLKKTETCIRTEGGAVLSETHDEFGRYTAIPTGVTTKGYIPDKKLDLQVGVVRNNLFIASQDVAAEWEILQKHNITHILNLGTYVDNFYPTRIKYRQLKVDDTIDVNVLKYFDLAFKFIDEGRSKGGVLIHCNAGVSRAATFMIGYLMSREKMPLDEAFVYVKSKRPKIWPNAGFLQQLRMFNEELGFGKSRI